MRITISSSKHMHDIMVYIKFCVLGSRESEVIENRLRVWLERLGDGSLKRYSVDHWPPWQQS